MREQGSGSIINISSASAHWTGHPTVTYPASKMGMVTFTRQLAIQNADRGVRANAILPGLMNTPMAVDRRARITGRTREEVLQELVHCCHGDSRPDCPILEELARDEQE